MTHRSALRSWRKERNGNETELKNGAGEPSHAFTQHTFTRLCTNYTLREKKVPQKKKKERKVFLPC